MKIKKRRLPYIAELRNKIIGIRRGDSFLKWDRCSGKSVRSGEYPAEVIVIGGK